MLRFFRKIRQNVLAEKQFSKYLLYALGEIILVVIGILIALQINTRNERRELSNEREKLIGALLSDAETTQKRLEQGLSMADHINRDLLSFMEMIQKETLEISIDTLKAHTSAVFQVANFTPAMSAYETALSTGDIGLLKNDELLDSYIQFTDNYEWFALHQKISGDMVYMGSVWKFREKLGSTRLFMTQMGQYPERFALSDDAFYAVLREKDTYATFESMQWLVRNQWEALNRAHLANQTIIDLLQNLQSS